MACVVAPGVARAAAPTILARATARDYAKTYWERKGYYAPCGAVRTRSVPLAHNVVGEFRPWHPCTIYLSSRFDWTRGGQRDEWWQVCATTMHEWGHLVGKGHSRNVDSIMASSLEENRYSWWWPYFPACRYDGDDADGDGTPDL